MSGLTAAGDRVFLMDNDLGLLSFTFSEGKVVDLERQSLEGPCWGVGATRSGNRYEIFAACDHLIVEMQYLPGYPRIDTMQTYPVETEISDLVRIQGNGQFITLQVGADVQLYQRLESNFPEGHEIFFLAAFSDVNAALLLHSNNILINQMETVINYKINRPLLSITSNELADAAVTIQAVSNYKG